MPILNYTTSISAHKTGAEINAALAKHGAVAVASMYADGEPSGVAFRIETIHGVREFELPANIDGVFKALSASRAVPTRLKSREQATRVSWRILKDWIEAQIAIIESGMAQLDEVMLPYMVTPSGATVAAIYHQRGQLAIEGAS